ncbi:hypothetical protein MHL39_10805 [Roseomonas mucosa]|uniref:hypothetical protein n=1 Tax=Roseomonas mucosa TaxID=207340 RepID=UPI001EF42FA4|nr:hypothetical protein [Roseomonas mucosa]MCG7357128.1 hypothetical protein [Roseomonas mucosa]
MLELITPTITAVGSEVLKASVSTLTLAAAGAAVAYWRQAAAAAKAKAAEAAATNRDKLVAAGMEYATNLANTLLENPVAMAAIDTLKAQLVARFGSAYASTLKSLKAGLPDAERVIVNQVSELVKNPAATMPALLEKPEVLSALRQVVADHAETAPATTETKPGLLGRIFG